MVKEQEQWDRRPACLGEASGARRRAGVLQSLRDDARDLRLPPVDVQASVT
jgi:hypothetical protein